MDLKKTPLYAKHVELGARMVPFGGWNMPVQYSGIIEEHLHTRQKAGLFDICHMGEFFMKGSSAECDLETLVTCKVGGMPVGRCRYGFLLNDEGGIIDDLIVFKLAEREFMLVVNASTIEKDKAWIKKHISNETVFRDESDATAKLDIQGPLSAAVVNKLTGNNTADKLKRYWFIRTAIDGVKILLSRTGYTGELGFELFFEAKHTEKLWDMFLKLEEVKPIGLGARDTLRLEMGYSLYGSDIDEVHTPIDASLERFVFMEKTFIGKEALLKQKSEELSKLILTGFICDSRRSARSHFDVYVDGRKSGIVTSGTFSPCLKRGIGLCYIDKKFSAEGTKIILSDGKIGIEAETKKPPFVEVGS